MPTKLHSSDIMVAKSSLFYLLDSIGETEPFTLTEIQGGFNNRAFRVDTGEKRYLLKEYFGMVRIPGIGSGQNMAFANLQVPLVFVVWQSLMLAIRMRALGSTNL